MAMQVILLERVENLGNLGEVVNVKPGYARNFLIPQQKALRATKDNIAYFETQKKEIEKQNETKRKEAEKDAKKIEGVTVDVIRHASESGQLYGSVTARDIADTVTESTGIKVARSTIRLNDALRTIGLYEVEIAVHPEVIVAVTVNIARTNDEAATQRKTGKALIADAFLPAEEKAAAAEEAAEAAKEEMLEEGALEAEKQREAEEAEEAAKEAAKKEAKAAKEAEKAAAAAAEEAEAEGEEAAAEEASEEAEEK